MSIHYQDDNVTLYQNIGDSCCGECPMGLCYVDHITGEASEGFGWWRQ